MHRYLVEIRGFLEDAPVLVLPKGLDAKVTKVEFVEED